MSAMTKRTSYILAVVIASIFIVVWVVVENLPPKPGVTSANFARINHGMTLVEAEEMFGRPADHIDKMIDGERICYWTTAPNGNAITDACVVLWISAEGAYRKRWQGEGFVKKIRGWLLCPPDEFL